MRRNTITLFKYVVVAAFLLFFGPGLLRLLFGGRQSDGPDLFNEPPKGLPVEPRKAQPAQVSLKPSFCEFVIVYLIYLPSAISCV